MADLPRSQSGKELREVAFQAAREAGRIIMAHFHHAEEVEYKGRGNITTQVDYLVEQEVLRFLREECPDFGILAEESPESKGASAYTWVLDPVDGTRNYASGIPFFSMTLALVRGQEVVLGLTYDPVREELFWAEKGRGAFLNDTPISVSPKPTVESALVGFDMGYDNQRARQALELVTALWPGMQSVRILGSAALGLAYAACGRLDLYFHHLLYPWDLASGLLLVQEAGGHITDRDGSPIHIRSQGAIASNHAIHADFLRLVAGYPWQGSAASG